MPEDRRKYPCVDCRTMGDEIERLRAENEALRAYTQHAPDCLYGTASLNEGPRKCDCGLHAALAAGETK